MDLPSWPSPVGTQDEFQMTENRSQLHLDADSLSYVMAVTAPSEVEEKSEQRTIHANELEYATTLEKEPKSSYEAMSEVPVLQGGNVKDNGVVKVKTVEGTVRVTPIDSKENSDVQSYKTSSATKSGEPVSNVVSNFNYQLPTEHVRTIVKTEPDDSSILDSPADYHKGFSFIDFLPNKVKAKLTRFEWSQLHHLEHQINNVDLAMPRKLDILASMPPSVKLSKKQKRHLRNLQVSLFASDFQPPRKRVRQDNYADVQIGTRNGSANQAQKGPGHINASPSLMMHAQGPQRIAPQLDPPMNPTQIQRMNPPVVPRGLLVLTLPNLNIRETLETREVARNILNEANSLLAFYTDVQLAFSANDMAQL